MRVFSIPRVVFLFAALLSIPCAIAQERPLDLDPVLAQRSADLDRDFVQPDPPPPPLPWASASIRGPVRTAEVKAVTPSAGRSTPRKHSGGAPGSPDDSTVVLPLSAGLSIVSLPVRAPSERLSDLFPDLPTGSRAWIWDVTNQKFVEGFDKTLPLGHACWLYVPVPVLLVVSGRPNLFREVSVDLERGWNLIGVPYDTPLLRSRQHVYVDWARTPFNDAVASRKLGSAIYTLDVNGYESVNANGSFQPVRGYWVYASGAELLELAQPGLSDDPAPAFVFPWGSVLSPIASFAVSSLLTEMGIGDTAKLNNITSQLDQLQTSLDGLSQQLSDMQGIIGKALVTQIGQDGWDSLVAPVQNALTTYYDEAGNAGESLAWFLQQAKSGTGTSVSNQVKTDFALHVLGLGEGASYAILEKFNNIHTAIVPKSGQGIPILDNLANGVVLTSADNSLKGHYVAMEAYYSTLVAMQIKCATLIMSAYNQLGSDPAWSGLYPAPQTATNWKTNTFEPIIKAETEAFLRAVENVAVQKIPVPILSSDPPVKVPDSVQVMMGMADLFVMGMFSPIYPSEEPEGIRVRVAVNPSADLPRLQWKPVPGSFFQKFQNTDLPSFGELDSDGNPEWRTVDGNVAYDDWILDPALKPAAFTDIPAFHKTNEWKLTRVILLAGQIRSAGGQGITPVITVSPAGDSGFWPLIPKVNVSMSLTDPSDTFSPYFGSITFAARPSTRDVFSPSHSGMLAANFVDVQHTNACANPPTASGLVGDTLMFNACRFDPSAVTLSYRFGYAGTIPPPDPGTAEVAQNGTWKADGTFRTFADFAYGDICATDFTYEFWEGDSVKQSAFDGDPLKYTFDWKPVATYTFKVKLVGDYERSIFNQEPACSAAWDYKGANITFP